MHTGGGSMGFLQEMAYTNILGFPVIGYLGIISYLLLVATAGVMILTRRKIVRIKATYHFMLARITITVATIHGILALAVYL
jgi:cytochrome b561